MTDHPELDRLERAFSAPGAPVMPELRAAFTAVADLVARLEREQEQELELEQELERMTTRDDVERYDQLSVTNALAIAMADNKRLIKSERRCIEYAYRAIALLPTWYPDETIRAQAERIEQLEGEVHALAIRRRESRGLLHRFVRYTTEDRATTPGSTRLARHVERVRDYLQRTTEPSDILRKDGEM